MVLTQWLAFRGQLTELSHVLGTSLSRKRLARCSGYGRFMVKVHGNDGVVLFQVHSSVWPSP